MKRVLPLAACGAAALVLSGTALAGAKNPPAAGPAAAPAAGKPAPSGVVPAALPRKYVRVVSTPFASPAGSQRRGDVACPAGTVPFGGGAVVQSNSTLVNVNSSFPIAGGWVADVNNASGAATTFELVVTCGKQPRRYAIVSSDAVANPSGSQNSTQVACPTGMKPLGGGGESNSFSLFVNINTTIPAGNAWRIDENNASASDATIAAIAVCGKLGGYAVVRGAIATIHANTQTPVTVTCPSVSVPVGGGIFSSSPSVGVNVNSTAADDENGWTSWDNNASAVDTSATPIVVCAGS